MFGIAVWKEVCGIQNLAWKFRDVFEVHGALEDVMQVIQIP